jgi:hypothetical protein
MKIPWENGVSKLALRGRLRVKFFQSFGTAQYSQKLKGVWQAS